MYTCTELLNRLVTKLFYKPRFFVCGHGSGKNNIKLVSIAAGAAIPAGSPAGHRAVFLIEGTASFDGDDFPTTSYFMLPSGERHGAISAKDDVKLMMVGWSKSEPVPFELF